jgi:zinc transport system permease protein
MQNALLIAILASIAAGVVGTFIVVRRMSLISGSIAHTAFGGMGLGYYLGINPLFGGVFFSIISALSIAILRKRSHYRIDTILSFLWSFGMSIGLVFIFLTPGYATDLFTYLFGNILLVSQIDLYVVVLLDLLILAMVMLFYNAFLSVLFDEEFAETQNVPVLLMNILLFGLIALTIVATIRVVGIVLMIAILTIPPATAQLFFKRIKCIMIGATVLTFIATLIGLYISYLFDLVTGPIIVLVISLFYLVSLFISRSRVIQRLGICG